MDEQQIDHDKQVPQIKLEASGPYDWKVIGGYVAYGVLVSATAYFFGSRIEKRCVKRVNDALVGDWLKRKTEGEA